MNHLFNKLVSLLAFALLVSTNVLHADTVTYIITDPAGSPIVGIAEGGGVVWREDYQPFGEKLENSSSSADSDIWFAGKEFDDETGLSFFGARNYEPTIGRFVSIDPMGFDESNIQSFGRYAYGNNNPYRFNDPDGESPLDLVFLAVDTVKLVGAIQSGVGIGAAVTDLAISAASVFSPVPGVGQAVKASRIGAKVVKSGNAARNVGQATVRTTRGGDKAVRIAKQDGSVIDISPKRVKEFSPNTHPNAPRGAKNRVKFDNAIPGSKGFKRLPTTEELSILKDIK